MRLLVRDWTVLNITAWARMRVWGVDVDDTCKSGKEMVEVAYGCDSVVRKTRGGDNKDPLLYPEPGFRAVEGLHSCEEMSTHSLFCIAIAFIEVRYNSDVPSTDIGNR
jgi:hypothetical protein